MAREIIMSSLWHVIRVVVVVLVPLVCAEETVHNGENPEFITMFSRKEAIEDRGVNEIKEQLLSKVSRSKVAKSYMSEVIQLLNLWFKMGQKISSSGNTAPEGNPLLKLKSMLSQMKVEENLKEEIMEIISQVEVTGQNPEEVLLPNLKRNMALTTIILHATQGNPAQRHTIEKLMKNHSKMEELLKKLTPAENQEEMEKLLEKLLQAEDNKNMMEKLTHQSYVFNSSYVKVVAAAAGWKDHSLRDSVVPLVYKAGLIGFIFAVSNRTIIEKLGRPIASTEDKTFYNPSEKTNLNKASLTSSSLTKGLLHVVGVAATTAGHLSEAYVRTILFSNSEKFHHFNNVLFSLITKTLSTNLVMLKHSFEMAVNFKNAVFDRYFKGPFPVSGTEEYFVKASDKFYAAAADLLFIFKVTPQYIKAALPTGKKSEFQAVMPIFLSNYEDAVERGIPAGYKTSPYPPLSYYWDMAALQYAVSLLSDIEGLAERSLEEQEHGTESLILNKKSLAKAVTAVHELLTSIAENLKSKEFQAALSSATKGIRLIVSHLEEAGVELRKNEGSETLWHHLESLIETIIPPPPGLSSPHLGFMAFITVKKPSARTLASLIPSDYNQLMIMITKPAALFARGPGSLGLPVQKIMAPFTEKKPAVALVTEEDHDFATLTMKDPDYATRTTEGTDSTHVTTEELDFAAFTSEEPHVLTPTTEEPESASLSKPLITEEPDLGCFDDALKQELYAGLFFYMSVLLEDEKTKPVLRSVLTETDGLSLFKPRDKCLRSRKCVLKILEALIQTAIIVNNPELHQQWQSTRSNPLKGKSIDELRPFVKPVRT